jgi:hypothetical protein
VDKGLPAYNCREFFIPFKEMHMLREPIHPIQNLIEKLYGMDRAAPALTLPWYGEERRLSLSPGWAGNALQKAIYYRNHFGM